MKSKMIVTFLFLLIAALFGWLMRSAQMGYGFFNYKYFLHTHSHIALLGWVYNSCLILIQYSIFKLPNDTRFNRLFWMSQITFLGMLFSFPFQGYALFSILFSTLYIFVSYYTIYDIFKRTKGDNTTSVLFLKWGLVYLFISSLGPFGLGYFMANDMGHTEWYRLSIYWFLHFLFNGFFLLVIFAYISKKIKENKGDNSILKRVFWLINTSIIPLYALSILWTEPHWIFYLIAGIGAFLQIIGILYLLPFRTLLLPQKGLIYRIVFTGLFTAFLLRVLFQLIGTFPPVQTFINQTVPFTVIGYIHLVMLGFFSLFFILVFIGEKYLKKNVLLNTGLLFFFIGILLSECLLFSQGGLVYFFKTSIVSYNWWLLIVSGLMPIGIILLFLSILKSKK